MQITLGLLLNVGSNGGSALFLASPTGVSTAPTAVPIAGIDESQLSPYPMLLHVTTLLADVLAATTLFTVPAGLSYVPGMLSNTTFSLVVSNPTLTELPFGISCANSNQLSSVVELPLNQDEKLDVGYLPDGFQTVDVGNSTNTTIAGGDTRVFMVTFSEPVSTLPTTSPSPRPRHMMLNIGIPTDASIVETIRNKPLLSQFYDGVLVDWTYVTNTDAGALVNEAQELLIMVRLDAQVGVQTTC